MFKFNTIRSTWTANILAAIVLTLVVNFSYLISMIVDERERNREMSTPEQQDEHERNRPRFKGVLHISRDGYGYLVAEAGDGFVVPPGWSESSENDSESDNNRDRNRDRDRDNDRSRGGDNDRDRDRDNDRDRDRDNDREQHRWYHTDSVYVHQGIIFVYNLQEGDEVLCIMNRPRQGGNPSIERPLEKNGQEISPVVYDRPNRNNEFVVQLFFYFALSLLVLTTMTIRFDVNNFTIRRYSLRCVMVMIVMAGCYILTPVVDWGPYTSQITQIIRLPADRMFDWMVIFKYLIVGVVGMIYGRIYGVLLKQQSIQLENEQLRTENIQTRYNMLLGQISPHFFFNSLNSLSMLVREQNEEKALAYIDQLSYTFRYIIQNGQNTISTLEEEMAFANAYGELFKVRYADKLFFDIQIDPAYNKWTLPALTLQPLIGNAVKHNTITRKQPLRVSIRTEGPMLVVSNRKAPKIESEPSTGIGLKNLRSRWMLITGRSFEIINTDGEFTVRLPLTKPVTA